jgi:hypothetical protein
LKSVTDNADAGSFPLKIPDTVVIPEIVIDVVLILTTFATIGSETDWSLY